MRIGLLESLDNFLSSTSLAIKIIKAWIIQANSFGISFSGLTLRPHLRLGFLFKVLPSDHIYQEISFDNFIIQNKTLFFNRELSQCVAVTKLIVAKQFVTELII